MALYDFLFGSPSRTEQIQRFTPQQQTGLNQILKQSLQGLQPQNFGSQFAPIAQQARNQFQQQTIPTIAERFTSMGAGGLSSPAFASQLGQAGAGLEENLAAQKANFGLQQMSYLQNLLGMGLTPQYDTMIHPETQGFLQSIAPSAIGAAGLYFGGPAYGLSSLLKLLNNQQSQQMPQSLTNLTPNQPFGNPYLNLLNQQQFRPSAPLNFNF